MNAKQKTAMKRTGRASRRPLPRGMPYLRGGDVWLVFPNDAPDSMSIGPSRVLAISKRTGRVIYDGSANAEG